MAALITTSGRQRHATNGSPEIRRLLKVALALLDDFGDQVGGVSGADHLCQHYMGLMRGGLKELDASSTPLPGKRELELLQSTKEAADLIVSEMELWADGYPGYFVSLAVGRKLRTDVTGALKSRLGGR